MWVDVLIENGVSGAIVVRVGSMESYESKMLNSGFEIRFIPNENYHRKNSKFISCINELFFSYNQIECRLQLEFRTPRKNAMWLRTLFSSIPNNANAAPPQVALRKVGIIVEAFVCVLAERRARH